MSGARCLCHPHKFVDLSMFGPDPGNIVLFGCVGSGGISWLFFTVVLFMLLLFCSDPGVLTCFGTAKDSAQSQGPLLMYFLIVKLSVCPDNVLFGWIPLLI